MAACVASHGYAGDQKIDGIGPYGAAVLSLTLGRKPETQPVDGNVARVVCRYFGMTFEAGEPRKKKKVHDLVESLLETQGGYRDKLELTYALVDLGMPSALRGSPPVKRVRWPAVARSHPLLEPAPS